MAVYKELLAEFDRMPYYLDDSIIATKHDLMEQIRIRRDDILCSISYSNKHTARYCKVMEDLLDQFIALVQKTVLPKRLEDWWRYSFEISHKGVMLSLEHIQSAFVNEDESEYSSEVVDQIFPLVFVRAKMLTVEEYAKLYDVEQVTVRQWIRRCKLRSVAKAGKEWRISELTDIPRRGFEGVQYRWWSELPDIPEGLEYIKEFRLLTLVKSAEDKYMAIFSEAKGPNSKRLDKVMENEERERLEAFFIGNPLVEFANETITYNHKKKIEPEEEYDEEDCDD